MRGRSFLRPVFARASTRAPAWRTAPAYPFASSPADKDASPPSPLSPDAAAGALAAAAPFAPFYEAPLAMSIKSLKRVSITTAALSLGIPPAVIFQGSEAVPLSGQVAITAITLLVSLGSTSAIHFLFSPYVLSMGRRPAAGGGGRDPHVVR